MNIYTHAKCYKVSSFEMYGIKERNLSITMWNQ